MGIRVLSLFDGIACGMQAFKNCGIEIDTYYASEIEPNAIKVATTNHPEIIEIGDVTKINFEDYIGKIDIIIGGSPCQGFSVSGKQLAFNDERSALIKYFFDAVEIIKPKYFLLENVVMQKKYEHTIDEVLGVKATRINSALVSPQQRIRLYWTNIPGITQPEQIPNLNIEREIGYQYSKETHPEGEFHLTHPQNRLDYADRCLLLGHTGHKNNQSTRVYSCKGKHGTLSLNLGFRFMMDSGEIRRLTAEGEEIIQGLPVGYTRCVGEGGQQKRTPLIGNGWCVPVIEHIFKFLKEDLDREKL